MAGRKTVFYMASWGPHALKGGTPNEGGPCTARCLSLGEAEAVAEAGARYFEQPLSARVTRIAQEDGEASFELGRWRMSTTGWVES